MKLIRKTCAIVLCVMIAVTFMPAPAFAKTTNIGTMDSAGNNYEVEQNDTETGSVKVASTYSNATDTVYKIMFAFDKLGAATMSDMSKLDEMMELYLRCSGIGVSLAGFAGAGVAILQMAGLIEDPTTRMLTQILTEIGNVQDQLTVINNKLDDISEELIDIAATQEETKRQTDAREMLTKWMDFNKKYIEDMANLMKKYKGFINAGARDWWMKGDHSAEGAKYLLYTHLQGDDDPALTFSRVDPQIFPEYSDSGEEVDKKLSIGIPAECMPETKNFNINTYHDDFLALYIPAIKNAAEEKKIIVDETSTFYTDWAAMNENAKNEKAAAYAEDLFNTIMYQIACKVMTDQNQFVIDVTNAYTNYCDNITNPQDGIDALISVLFATHAFENEVKDDVEKYCCGMVAQAGVYGEFAMSCASQSSLQQDEDIAALADKWMDTIDKLDAKKSTSLTGKDNYCYIKNLVLDYKEVKVQSTATINWHFAWNGGLCFDDYESTKWRTVDKNGKDYALPVLKDEYAIVLYHYYLSQKKGDETFVQFLRKNGVNIPENFRWKLVTNYKGSQIFSLADGLEMTCHALETPNGGFGDYFTGGEKYRINKGNPSKVHGECFVLHDQALCNYMDLSSGTIKTNQFWAARALYAEHDGSFHDDEVHAFYADATVNSESTGKGDYHTETLTFTEPVRFLELSAPPVSGFTNRPEPTALNLFTEKFNLGFEDEETDPFGTINKAANPLKISAKTATVKYKKLKKKTQTLAINKVIKFTRKLDDKKTYTLSSVKKGNKSFKKYFKINRTTGNVTIKKNSKMKKGTYKVKVMVTAAGNSAYDKAVKQVIFRLRVK